MLARVEIEHELTDRAFQPRQSLLQHHEARARQFRGGLEIHVAERATEIIMRLRREGVVADLAVDVTLHIAMLVCAFGHVVERQVRNRCQLFGQHLVRRLRGKLELRHRGLELGDFRHELGGARVVLGFLGLADFLRSRIAPRLGLLRRQDRRAAFFVDRQQRSRQWRQPAALQSGVERLGVVADRFDVMHWRAVLGRQSATLMLIVCGGPQYHNRHHPRKRVIQYSRAAVIESRVAAYWIPRFRGE